MHIRNVVHCTGCVHMFSIGRCSAYADGEYMRMSGLCRCRAYGYVTPIHRSLFFREIRKKQETDLLSFPLRSAALKHKICHHLSSVIFYILCFPLPCDPARSAGKGRCGYSVGVVHFRKLRNSVKIGSDRNGHPVI